MLRLARLALTVAVMLLIATACSPPPEDAVAPAPDVELPRIPQPGEFGPASHTYELTGPLVPYATTMVTAWDLPQNPETDAALDRREDGELIRQGFRLFTATPGEASRFTPSEMTCANCHLNSGQRELALPLVGSAGMFPEHNGRAGRMFSLEDRIVGCFYRSENAVHGPDNGGLEAARAGVAPGLVTDSTGEPLLPDVDSEEVVALAAYLQYLSEGYTPGEDPAWRKRNRIAPESLLPLDALDAALGEEIYTELCVNCHGPEGQGVQVGDKKPGPLWGPQSWNDGAGLARFYTLAGFVRYAMPYLDPGVLSDADAQHVSTFIISKPRPSYPYKDQDWQIDPMPIDAAFYRLGDGADGHR
ncbi:MAG: c-type cytochrome [Vicinamibacterales bacterium]|jgi:thiosulfate dehydrogenase|nr:hypothetical protein [Acidobacteriota bacterium]MDP6373534.1 c-type cytochrome [Vicinamibacterales bacterium]MDP6610415.1 c-type cytochrome [Vicinamibacterales bacterium]HAK56015.1 hypothetical protein [Acidobacteriota bacterium]|tara:strand:- start:4620 stop:5699 length:1080 start_codon:yes stop_codon:yes gene_type:complete